MPHIAFDQKIDLKDFSKKFKQILKTEPNLIKISTIFVDKDARKGLLPTTTISNIKQQFLIEISTSDSKTTLRLYPNTDPTKTNEVKISLALLAKQILDHYTNFKITKTNLADFINR